jgi:Bacterial SH3 domain
MAGKSIRAAALAALMAILPFASVYAASPATTPRYQRLGDWNHVDVVYRYGTDETITFASDDTWARQVREVFIGSGAFGLRCIYPNFSGNPSLDCNEDPSQGPVSRPGWVTCAFIQRYNGYWQMLVDYTSIGVGQSLIAIRDDGSTPTSGNDCSAIYEWTIRQNTMNDFLPPATTGGGGGGGGGGVAVLPPQHKAQQPRSGHQAAPMITLYVDAASQGYIGANLRAQPSRESAILLLISNGASVLAVAKPVKGADGHDWYSVTYKGRTGYVLGSLLSRRKPSGSSAAGTAPLTNTRVIVFHPTGTRGKYVAGSCIGSKIAPRPNAWRCFVSGGPGVSDIQANILEPCFGDASHPTYVICNADPVGDTRGIELTLEERPSSPNTRWNRQTAWLLRLADGSVCRFFEGTPLAVNVSGALTFIRNSCGRPAGDSSWHILSYRTGRVWMAQKVLVSLKPGSEHGSVITKSFQVVITTAWL